MKQIILFTLLISSKIIFAQNPLYIPPTLTGTTFNLNIQNGVTQFWSGINTNTYGINHSILAPTIIVNKGDSITLNVTNNLTGTGNSTTIHWHGLHVAPENDGGPHQIINQGSTWSPSFKVRNNASTFWYHPHGHNKTDRHVSKGVAGFFIVKDAQEALLNLPRTYGVDDIPLCIQTKEFDVLSQIAIATFMDTLVLVNATRNPTTNIPAQVVRLRLLNGASQRTFQIGFSNNMNFSLISNDGGLLDAPQTLNRLLLTNGERAEILVDFSTHINDTIYLKCFGSELSKGIYGADSVGDAGANQITDYYNNYLNGIDYNLMQINVVSPTATPITSIPPTLIPATTLTPDINTVYRKFVIDTIGDMGVTPNFAGGPFAFNAVLFDMDSINETVILNNKEIWTIHNKTMIAHPFHIHDIEFKILDINGMPPPAYERGWKDVVLILPGDSLRFITQFTDFANDSIPYMYHCHILHHEDDGMMGSFLVIDTNSTTGINSLTQNLEIRLFPNPSTQNFSLTSDKYEVEQVVILNELGQELATIKSNFQNINLSNLNAGIYFIKVRANNQHQIFKIIKQ